MLTSAELVARCADDDEFRLAARRWNGSLQLVMGDDVAAMGLRDGEVRLPSPGDADLPTVRLAGPAELWEQILSPRPPRFCNDIFPAEAVGLVRTGDELTYWRYYPAIARAVELVRLGRGPAPNADAALPRRRPAARFDSPVGRYVHLDLDGHDHRIYFEEAGQGIPLLLQHTAGSHGVQFRHLFEVPEITDHFRLIAYDLPFHGKSVPPPTRTWWAQEYRLTKAFAMSVPLALSDALELDRPAFLGCSVGGQLALDLAHSHPGRFRAVIALEGALKLHADLDDLVGFWHPGVSNETKARMMHGLTAPDSPEPLRRETVWAYSCGWPPSFIGDLHYYFDDHDLRDVAGDVDTARCAVHLLTGEYDFSATVEHGREAHEAMPGSTFAVMDGLGHFPMCEDPDRFLPHLLPVLARIRQASGPVADG